MKRSILRTARHHRDLDRNMRVQHGKGPTDEQRLAAIKKAKADPDNGRKPSVILIQYQGYHRCTCRACSLARGYWARQTVKAIVRYLENYRDENGIGIKIDLPNIDFNAPGNERITAIYSDQYLAALTAAAERSGGRPIIFFDDMPPLNHQTARET